MDSTVIASWQEQAASIPMTRAQVLADAGRTEEAIEAFRQLAADNPEDLLISRNLATLLIQAGRNEEAFQVYDRMLQMEGLGPEDYYSVGVGYYQGEQYERAAEAFGMAADVAVNLRDAIEMQARSLQIDSAYSEIPEVAERWIELDPNNQNAYIILAQAANQLGDAERAQELVAAIEGLAVTMDNLQMRRFPDGGAQVTGGLKNVSLDPGTPVQIEFSFYDAAGNVLGTQSTTVTTGQAEMVETFQIEYPGPERVDGYGYELSYPS